MNRAKKRISSFLALICSFFMLSQTLYAASNDISLGDFDKTIYKNLTVDYVSRQFSENSYAASERFEDYKIGLLGTIKSISDNGKKIYFEPTSSGQEFSCVGIKGDNLDKVKTFKQGDFILVCGEVNDCDSEKFEVDTDNIKKLSSSNTSKYVGSKSSSDCTIFYSNKMKSENVDDKLAYSYCSDWSEITVENLEDGFVGASYKNSNDEYIGIYYISKKTIEDKVDADDGFFSFFTNDLNTYETRTEMGALHYVTQKNTQYNIKYGTEKINGTKYSHFYSKDEDETDKIEAYTYFTDDLLIIVTYEYSKKPEDLSWMSLLLNTLTY